MVAAVLEMSQTRSLAGLARVTDGDTIRLEGVTVRLRGIDAPELRQACTGADGTEHACGRLSASYLETLIGTSPVDCSGYDTDRYDRLLGDCRAGDGAAVVALNRSMVEAGWAVAFGDHERAEALARADRRGLWAWEFERPADWRRHVAGEASPTLRLGALVRRARSVLGLGGHHE